LREELITVVVIEKKNSEGEKLQTALVDADRIESYCPLLLCLS
jgi:hypothetical protein